MSFFSFTLSLEYFLFSLFLCRFTLGTNKSGSILMSMTLNNARILQVAKSCTIYICKLTFWLSSLHVRYNLYPQHNQYW
jgi:hypothetical protein